MGYYAVETLDDALDEARTLLMPFSVSVWLRLAVVSLFAGGSVGTRTPSLSVNVTPTWMGPRTLEYLPRLVLIAAAALVLGAVFLWVGSVLEFVLVHALRSRTVRLWGPFKRSLGWGTRLFAFRAALGVLVLLPVAVVAAFLFTALTRESVVFALGGVFLVPVVAVIAVGAVVASAATTAFVVPLMADRDLGVLEGWRAFWPTLRTDLPQFVVYAVVRFALAVLAGVLTSIVAGAFAVPIAAAMGGLALGGDLSMLALAAVVVLGVLAALALLVAVRVPIITYLRYHSLLVLAASPAEFRLR